MNPEQLKLLKKLAELGDVTYLKSSLSKEELIVKAISEMDFETLEILFENISNFDEKKGFLVEINSEFKKFKENKDTQLIAYSGKCGGSFCGNLGSNGYSFTGNISNTFYNLVFEKENGKCKGVCKCYKFNVDDEIINKARLEAEKIKFDSYGFTQSELEDLPF